MPRQELLIAQLSEIGFDGFEQGDDFLKACIVERHYDEASLRSIDELDDYSVTREIIEQRNGK